MEFGKYLGCVLSLEAYSWIGNVISDDNLGLNLCVVPTIYHVVIILNDKVLKRSERDLS